MGDLKSRKTLIEYGKNSIWNFYSALALHPMRVTINVDKPGTDPGLIFVAPYTVYGDKMIGQTCALIMDQAGNPIWFRLLDSIYKQNTDFRVQIYHGQPVITMWEGTFSGTQSANPLLSQKKIANLVLFRNLSVLS